MWSGRSSIIAMRWDLRSGGYTQAEELALSRAMKPSFSSADENAPLNLQFTGYSRRRSTQLIKNCVGEEHESLNLWRRSRGVCGSSRWKMSMETGSIFTVTE